MPGRTSGSTQKLGEEEKEEEEEDGDLLSFPLKDEIKSPPTFSPPPGETLFCIYENATVLLFFSRTQFPGRKEKKRDAQKVFSPLFFFPSLAGE